MATTLRPIYCLALSVQCCRSAPAHTPLPFSKPTGNHPFPSLSHDLAKQIDRSYRLTAFPVLIRLTITGSSWNLCLLRCELPANFPAFPASATDRMNVKAGRKHSSKSNLDFQRSCNAVRIGSAFAVLSLSHGIATVEAFPKDRNLGSAGPKRRPLSRFVCVLPPHHENNFEISN